MLQQNVYYEIQQQRYYRYLMYVHEYNILMIENLQLIEYVFLDMHPHNTYSLEMKYIEYNENQVYE
jgi:hypothetical protein